MGQVCHWVDIITNPHAGILVSFLGLQKFGCTLKESGEKLRLRLVIGAEPRRKGGTGSSVFSSPCSETRLQRSLSRSSTTAIGAVFPEARS